MSTLRAYILIQTEAGPAGDVSREIAKIKGVASAQDVSGPYDIIVVAEARNLDDLGRNVVVQIQKSPGIIRTLTCPVVHLS
ncbi:MAG: Lrp/AsnC ligand binding domain-containing protein [Actinomycetota bacterium]|nr:Lrp/AsnC ligand binding domain-containing protein [Actinomycetota bacterium]